MMTRHARCSVDPIDLPGHNHRPESFGLQSGRIPQRARWGWALLADHSHLSPFQACLLTRFHSITLATRRRRVIRSISGMHASLGEGLLKPEQG